MPRVSLAAALVALCLPLIQSLPPAAAQEPRPSGLVLTLRNQDPKASKKTGEIFFDRPDLDKLDVTLKNATGKDLRLEGAEAGVDATVIDVSLPGEFFPTQELVAIGSKIKLSDPEGRWVFSMPKGRAGRPYLRLTAEKDGVWRHDETLKFALTGAASDKKQPPTANVELRFGSASGADSLYATDTLALRAYPTGQLKELDEDVQCTLDNSIVYISRDLKRPYRNTLILNIKNKKRTEPLIVVDKDKPRTGPPPMFKIYFVTGEGPGALTEDIDPTKVHRESTVDSARNIHVGIARAYGEAEGNKWEVVEPKQGADLVWTAAPAETNLHVLGTGDAANLEIAISSVVTRLEPGKTQIYVEYSHFPGYRDGRFTLGVTKEYPTPRIIGFHAKPTTIKVGESVQLDWNTIAVDDLALEYTDENGKVQRLTHKAGQLPLDSPNGFKLSPRVDTDYQLVGYDAKGIQIPGVSASFKVFVQWPSVTVRRVWTEPFAYPERDNGSGPVTLLWQAENVTPWHKIKVYPGGISVPGGATSWGVTMSRSAETAKVEIYDLKNPQPVASGSVVVKSMKESVLAYQLRGSTYRAQRNQSLDFCGLPEGDSRSQLYVSGVLSFQYERLKPRDSNLQDTASYEISYRLGSERSPTAVGKLAGPVQANGYTVAMNQFTSFRYDPATGAIQPFNLNAPMMPQVIGAAGAVTAKLQAIARSTRSTLNSACASKAVADALNAVMASPMRR